MKYGIIVMVGSFYARGGDDLAVIEIRSRYERYANVFGKTVRVTVNRPISTGDATPRYTVNGGYIRGRELLNCGILDPSRQAAGAVESMPVLYAYIVGINEPLVEFEGEVIAVLHREGRGAMIRKDLPFDHNDRLIIAPKGAYLLESDIRAAVADAEERFCYRLFCRYEKSCGAVVYTLRDGNPLYLLIRNRSGHIGFPKGHVEYKENEAQTMAREIMEETSLSVTLDLSFREEYRYQLWGVVQKTAVYSVAYFEDGARVQTLDSEIFGDWLLPYEEAYKMLSYENDRTVLAHAHAHLIEKESLGAYDILHLQSKCRQSPCGKRDPANKWR